jgi:hypothetical protein
LPLQNPVFCSEVLQGFLPLALHPTKGPPPESVGAESRDESTSTIVRRDFRTLRG